MIKYLILFIILIGQVACKSDQTDQEISGQSGSRNTPSSPRNSINIDYDTLRWQEILSERSGIKLDIRYATEDNFTDQIIYPCSRCFLRPKLAKKLRQIQKDIHERYGWSLVLFDCYRPRAAQERLWEIKPDPSYVTPPHKGSMHNRGLAVDLSLLDQNGALMDMGTDYDFFGIESHITYKDHPKHVHTNRFILEELMRLHGLEGIRTEWWHYSLRSESAELSDWEWPCP